MHRESVRVALDQLERYTQARIGGNHPPETTAKFIAAKFEHDTARPVDGYVAPQLHTQAVVFNVTQRDNGQPRAIQPQSLFASQQFVTAVYQSELTYKLLQLAPVRTWDDPALQRTGCLQPETAWDISARQSNGHLRAPHECSKATLTRVSAG